MKNLIVAMGVGVNSVVVGVVVVGTRHVAVFVEACAVSQRGCGLVVWVGGTV